MTINGFNSAYDGNTNYFTITPSAFSGASGESFTLSTFWFGKTYANNTSSYMNIINSNSWYQSVNRNQAQFNPSLTGLGLPSTQYS